MGKRDKVRKAIQAALRADSSRSDRAIARELGVSHHTVAATRKGGQFAHASKKHRRAPARAGESPYEYALRIMNSRGVEARRRDQMCRALLAFQKGGGRAASEPLPEPPPKPVEPEGERSWAVILGDNK